MRLDKFLSEMGTNTRSEIKKLIKKGAVTIDGDTAVRPDQKINPEKNKITCLGSEVLYTKFEYYMLNKPGGCVTAKHDSHYPVVMDYICSVRKDLFPVGRLDLDTEGLLLITNDGKLSHDLLSPAKHVPKTYEARIMGRVTKEDVNLFAAGVDIGEEKLTKPAILEIQNTGEESLIRLTITEGRYHQVKRMFEAVGKEVLFLKRIRMGSLKLDKALKPGESRPLTREEIIHLKNREEL